MTLKAVRINRGLKVKEASKKIGVSEGTLRNYENFKTIPNGKILAKIVEVYEVDFKDVILVPKDECEKISSK